MATVVPPYVFPTGTVLDPDQMDRDFDSAVDGESVYGEMRGHLQDSNFAGGFRIRPEHIRYGETARLNEDSLTETLDYYDDYTPNDTATEDSEYTPIAGASTRVFLPYAVTCALYSASIFYTVYRVRQRALGAITDTRTGPPIKLKLWVDGTAISHTVRQTPITYWPEKLDTATCEQQLPLEHVLTQHYDCNHLIVGGAGCAAGYHNVSMRLYIPQNIGQENMWTPYKQIKFGTGDHTTYNMSHRFRCGVRSARVIGLL